MWNRNPAADSFSAVVDLYRRDINLELNQIVLSPQNNKGNCAGRQRR